MPRTDTAQRLIDAPPGRVYAALVDAEAVAAWLPPGDMTGTVDSFDPRPGGSYRMTLRYPDTAGGGGKSTADADVVEGRFVEVVPGQRVAYAVAFESGDPAYDGVMTMTWALTAVEGRTRVEITAEGVPDAIAAEDHAAGMSSSLEKLAAYLGG